MIVAAVGHDIAARGSAYSEPSAHLLSRLARSPIELLPGSTRFLSTGWAWLLPVAALLALVVIVLVVSYVESEPSPERVIYRVDTVYLRQPVSASAEPAAIDSTVMPGAGRRKNVAQRTGESAAPSLPPATVSSRRQASTASPDTRADDVEAITRQLERESPPTTIPVRRKDSVKISVELDR